MSVPRRGRFSRLSLRVRYRAPADGSINIVDDILEIAGQSGHDCDSQRTSLTACRTFSARSTAVDFVYLSSIRLPRDQPSSNLTSASCTPAFSNAVAVP